jgi:cytochrome c oxidase subunit 2
MASCTASVPLARYGKSWPKQGKLVVIKNIMKSTGRLPAALAAAAMIWGAGALGAMAGVGQPSDRQLGLQDPVTEVAGEIHKFHDLVNVIIIAITIFVFILLAIVIFRFNERANPVPSKTTHHTGLEIAWTVIPIIILIVIAVPSFKLLYLQYSYPKPDLTIKAIGNAWYWDHEYPDHDGFKVTSNMVRDEDILKAELGEAEFDKRYKGLDGVALSKRLYTDAQPLWKKRNQVRMLSVDNEIAVPENKVVHVLVTATDVIHNWTIPSFGSKIDAVPGRVTATWFRATRKGIYYGQCSELCGKDHAAMPIAVRVVSQADFDAWAGALKAAKGERDSAKRRELINRARDVMRKAALEDGSATVHFAGTASAGN